MRVVLDTNAFLVSIPRKSKYRLIFDRLITTDFELIISNEILTEYTEVISSKTNIVVASNIAELLLSLPNTIQVNIHFSWNLIQEDPSDNKFADAALWGDADYQVTSDKHFNVLHDLEFPKIKLISISAFLALLIGKQ